VITEIVSVGHQHQQFTSCHGLTESTVREFENKQIVII
jgi:hypothetical protein